VSGVRSAEIWVHRGACSQVRGNYVGRMSGTRSPQRSRAPKPVALSIGWLITAAIGASATPASAVDSYYDYYEFYAHYGAGYDNSVHDDDWFYDYYDFKADAYAPAYEPEWNDYDYDADAYAWEERGLFD
jgi:hypothetical protein